MMINVSNAGFSIGVLEITLWGKPFERRFVGFEATTSFPAKYRLKNEHRNFILMTCHYSNVGSASAMIKKIPFAARPIRALPRSG